MPGAPVVGIVVPLHQAEEFVADTLESVLGQTHTAWECVVVDDGSRDDSAARAQAVVGRDPRFTLVRTPNRGVSAARNTGLDRLSPAVRQVAFLDADDRWVDTALEHLVAALAADPDAVGVFGWAELMDSSGAPLHPGAHPARQRDRRRIAGRRLQPVPPGEPLTFDEVVVVGPIWPPAVALHRKDVLDRVGSFDATLRQNEDWDLYLRMARHGHYVQLPEQVAWYRQHGGQATLRTVEQVVDLDRVRRKAWESAGNSPAQRRAATRAWRQLQLRRTARCGQRAVRALARREWLEALRLSLATGVLLLQNVGNRPPRTPAWLVRWSRRER